MYYCPCPEPGTLAEPYHIPGYSGHIPTIKARTGGSIGRLSREIVEDPCVAQAPIPILQAPLCPPCGSINKGYCCGPPPCMQIPCSPRPVPTQTVQASPLGSCGSGAPSSFSASSSLGASFSSSPCCDPRVNVGCVDIGCNSGFCCPPPKLPQPKPKPVCEPHPCVEPCDVRSHHLNRGPYACPCRPEPDRQIYRCCESMSSSYTGHVPGFTFHSNGRTFGKSTWGTKQYMDNCFYYNTFSR